MDTLITRLNEQTEGLDTSDLAPAATLPSVVRRGRRYMVAMTTAAIVGTTAAVAGAAVAVPQVIELFEGPQTPVVEPISDEESEEAAEEKPEPMVEEVAEDKDGIDAPPPPAPAEEAAPVDDTAPADATAPDFFVLSPADGAEVTQAKVTFTGEVEPGATVMAGPYEATVKDDGSWSILLIAEEGANPVTFTATDAAGNTTTSTLTITYAKETNEDGTTKEPIAEDATLTANQQKAELPSAPHTNVYWGTAAPGDKVAVLSDYGTGYVWADDSGSWELEVDFDPPAGEKTFQVTVKLYEQPSVRQTFTLTTVREGAPAADFSANQQSSELTSEPYTNVYWGTAAPGEKIKVLSDHGWDYVYADEAGDWELAVTFDPPPGTKEFDVTARYYHDSSVARTFRLTTVAPAAAEFAASQQSSSVPAASPTNVYSGTGEPGHEVWIWTEAHGQWWTTIAPDGTWEVAVTYESVSSGDAFQVKAKDTITGQKHFFEVGITG